MQKSPSIKLLKKIIDNNLEKIPNDNITTIKLYYDEILDNN